RRRMPAAGRGCRTAAQGVGLRPLPARNGPLLRSDGRRALRHLHDRRADGGQVDLLSGLRSRSASRRRGRDGDDLARGGVRTVSALGSGALRLESGLMADAARLLKRAATAKRSSKRVALKEDFDSGAPGDWLELVRDVAALANSGGGVVVVRSAIPLEEELLHEQLARYVEPDFEGFELYDVTRGGRGETAVVVDSVLGAPLVFSAQGRYRDRDG